MNRVIELIQDVFILSNKPQEYFLPQHTLVIHVASKMKSTTRTGILIIEKRILRLGKGV